MGTQALRKPATDEKTPKKGIEQWQKDKDGTRTTKTIRINEELWRQIKISCATKGEQISDFFERLAKKELKIG